MNGSGGGPSPVVQQIVLSGLGGQGILFLSRLLAEAAVERGLPVLTSETHGMAQRGGVVLAHLKVGPFSSPLVRAGRADGLIVLQEENLPLHLPYLSPGGWVVVNAPSASEAGRKIDLHAIDAGGLAAQAGYPRSANLVLIGFALARLRGRTAQRGLFCTPGEILRALSRRGPNEGGPKQAQAALELGILHGR